MRKDGKTQYEHLKEYQQLYRDLLMDLETILIQDWSKETPKERLAKIYIKYKGLNK